MDSFVSITGTGLRFASYAALPFLLLPLFLLVFPKPLAGLARGLSLGLDRISGIAMSFSVAAAFLIILIQLSAVLLRYVFGLSFSWMNDSVIFTFAMIFMLGAAATLRDDGHVRVDILRGRFGARTRAGIELFGAMAFIFPIGILILYSAAGLVARSWTDLEPFNESDGLPIQYVFKTLVPVFAVLMISQGLSQALKAALVIRGLRDPDEAEHAHGGAV